MEGGRLRVVRAGLIGFDEAWEIQREFAAARREALLLLEHPAIYTLGKNGRAANVIDAHGIPVKRIDRGGDVTYHGPGQLVGYPILDLRARRIGVREHVARIERSIVATLAGIGVEAAPKTGCVGVWTARGKIASLGLRVADGVSMHGFALNVNNDLRPFGWITPCGAPGGAVSSVSEELGRRIEVAEVADRLAGVFAKAQAFDGVEESSLDLTCGLHTRRNG